MHWTLILGSLGSIGDIPFFSNAPLAAAERRRVRWTTTIGQRAWIVNTAVFGPSHWNCIRSGKNGENTWSHYRILTPNELDLSFLAPNDCAKFHHIRFKIETIWSEDIRHASDLIICPMLCYINGIDNNNRAPLVRPPTNCLCSTNTVGLHAICVYNTPDATQ